jgi:Zn-dependent metalloprotease
MITPYTITSTAWTAISAAGESGSCWLDEENDGSKGHADVRITHSASGVPNEAALEAAKKVYRSSGNDDVCLIGADSASDIWYARCKTTGDEVIINADVA